ncbi:MAG: UDP-4-amino-4,6-dideoxy-N-acetyl-beta-L-altrosamine transaminase [Magnetococcales bacterium]|nr:UDP-4-amino-4,6-dideoxy-N-acetyl-beta-L-altrosamine transaminase [Magnetococcales bacterium]
MTGSDLPFLPYGRQLIEADDVAAVAAALQSGWLTTGPAVTAFETALARTVSCRHAVVCANGTAALHLTALALGLGPGDAVIVPAVTFLATANAARFVGAEVRFADVDPDTGLMESRHLEEAWQRDGPGAVKAVFPVHLNGQCVALPELWDQARARGVPLVEDACHALGTTYAGPDGVARAAGGCHHSTLGVFSFHPVKTVAMGEGGAITTNDDRLAQRLRLLRSHGMHQNPMEFRHPQWALDPDGQPNPWYYEMAEVGYNYRASDLHCALGCSQLHKLPRLAARRRELAALYDRLLAPLAPLVRPIPRQPGNVPVWHLYVVRIDFATLGRHRGAVMQALRDRGIGTQVHYLPLHRQPYYRQRYGELDLPGAWAYYRQVLSLPLFPAMENADVERVVEELGRVMQ